MPGVFKALGLEFQYPDNWLAEHEAGDVDAEEGQGVQVIVSSPQTAFWQLSRFRAGAELESLFDEALGALRAEYKNIEVEPCSNADRPIRLQSTDHHRLALCRDPGIRRHVDRPSFA